MYIYITHLILLVSTFGCSPIFFMIMIQDIEIYFIEYLHPNFHQSECAVTI